MKKAVIIGSRGQDGRLLGELLSEKGQEWIGISRGGMEGAPWDGVDINSPGQVARLVEEFEPDQIFYLAAFHHSAQEAQIDRIQIYERSQQVHVTALISFLEAILRFRPTCRLFYAASSLIFGHPAAEIQTETTPFTPDSIYGITKLSGLLTCRYYREAHQLFLSTGILYNHESPYRAPKFISRKIVQGALAIKQGRQSSLILGDLDAVVDWGFAPDYVRAMQLILEAEIPGEFIIASGQRRTVREFVAVAFDILGLEWEKYVQIDQSMIRRQKPTLIGNSAKLTAATGWTPQTTFHDMIKTMIEVETFQS